MIHAPRAAERARVSASRRPNPAAARSAAAGFGRFEEEARARLAALGAWIILLLSYHGSGITIIIVQVILGPVITL